LIHIVNTGSKTGFKGEIVAESLNFEQIANLFGVAAK
jgi:hypothetical protein